MRHRCLLALAVGWSAVLGCDTLPEIPSGQCGNGVIEAGEDCDLFAPPGLACHPSGSPNACRFACEPRGSVGPSCPTGSSCGLDKTCSYSSDEYEPLGPLLATPVETLLSADFDGDGRVELLTLGHANAQGQAIPRVLFYTPTGTLRSSFEPEIPANSPVILPAVDKDGDLPKHGLLLGTSHGLAALGGSAERGMFAVPFPYQVMPKGWDYRVLRVKGNRDVPLGEGIVAYFGHAGVSSLGEVDGLGEFAVFPRALSAACGVPQAGELVEGPLSPCEELVLTFHDDAQAYRLEPCDAAGHWQTKLQDLVPIARLPAGKTIARPATLADLNADGHLDLVLTDSAGGNYVSFGLGDGTFAASLESKSLTQGQAWPITFAQLACAMPAALPTGPVLAVGVLDADGLADWVSPSGVFLQRALTTDLTHQRVLWSGCPSNAPFGSPWSLARVADFNRDGRQDLVTASETVPDLEYLLGTGRERLNRFVVPTDGPVSALVTGDFDGDLLFDVAVGVRPVGRSDQLTQLSLVFGSAFGAPSAPVFVGEFRQMKQLAAANYDTRDVIEELGVIGQAAPDLGDSLTVFIGNTGRRPVAPLGLIHVESDGLGAVGSLLGSTALSLGSTPTVTGVVLAEDQSHSSSKSLRFWVAPNLDSTYREAPRPSAALADFIPWEPDTGRYAAAFVVGDLDGQLGQEALLLSPGTTPTSLRLWQLRLLKDGTGFEKGDLLKPLGTLAGLRLGRGAPQLVDLDADGLRDLVFIADDARHVGRLAVVWNDAGTLRFEQPAWADFGGESLRGFVVQERNSASRILAVTAKHAYWLELSYLKRAPLAGTLVAGLPGGEAVSLGDITGDGLEDVSVAVNEGIQLFAQKARRP